MPSCSVPPPRGRRYAPAAPPAIPRAARKAAVEIAPVGQIARMGDEAEDIGDRHQQHRAGQRFGPDQALREPLDHRRADDLVPVDRRADEHRRAGPRAMQHPHRERGCRAGRHRGDRKGDIGLRAGRDRLAGDDEWLWLRPWSPPFPCAPQDGYRAKRQSAKPLAFCAPRLHRPPYGTPQTRHLRQAQDRRRKPPRAV
jgi:hypothetical protein